MGSHFFNWITSKKPSWMGPKAKRIWGAFATVLGDRTVEWMLRSIAEHMPSYASAQSNALTASERQIEPGPTETNVSLAARLIKAVPTWKRAGTPAGLLLALAGAELGNNLVIVQQNGLAWKLQPTAAAASAPWTRVDISDDVYALWYATLGPGPASVNGHAWWTFDANDAFCSRFAIIYEAGSTVDLSVAANLSRLCRVVKLWKPAKASLVKIYAVSGGNYWGAPGLVWGGFNWGGTVTTYTC